SDLSALRAYYIDSQLPDTLFNTYAKHFRRMIDGARRLQPNRPKRDRRPISRSTIAQVSHSIQNLPQSLPPNGLTPSKRDELNLAVAARVAFAGFLRVGEFTYNAGDLRSPDIFAATKLSRADV